MVQFEGVIGPLVAIMLFLLQLLQFEPIIISQLLFAEWFTGKRVLPSYYETLLVIHEVLVQAIFTHVWLGLLLARQQFFGSSWIH